MTPLVPSARRVPARRIPLAAAAALASSAAIVLLAAAPAHAAATVSTLENQDAAAAANSLIGEHVSLTAATLAVGRAVQAGSFADLDLGLPAGPVSGLALTTGSLRAADPTATGDVDFTASALVGPNVKLTTTGDLGGAGSAPLESAFGATTYDAAELRLEVVPAGDTLTIEYHIGSEEYAGWAERDYIDAFGVFVDGTLCSTLGAVPAGVDSINPDTRPELFVSNLTADGAPGSLDTEMNGFSAALTCTAAVTPGQSVEIVAAVADTVDGHLDSTLMLTADGISSVPGPELPTPTPTPSPTDAQPTASAAPVPASVNGPAVPGAARPGSPLAITGVDGASLATGVGLAVAAVGAGVAAIVVARRRRAAQEVNGQ